MNTVYKLFFFICINLQIALAFFGVFFFSSVKMTTGSNSKCDLLVKIVPSEIGNWKFHAPPATVVGYMYVFGSGLLGAFLFLFFVENKTFPCKFLS